ncbi:hypothetical protein [Streptomyces caelestis]|nr:hypothetical protein [Streptomyces caelestis]
MAPRACPARLPAPADGGAGTTLYEYVPELAAGRDSLVATAAQAALPAPR